MKEKELKVDFKLVKILERQFSMFPDTIIADKQIEQKVGFSFGAEKFERIIACGCTYSLLIDNIPFIHIEVVCHFQIEFNDWSQSLYKEKDNAVMLPNLLAEHLASIVASTTRGVLFANTKETILKNYPMSLINVHDILRCETINIPLE